MQPGDEWAYRLRDSALSERVRIASLIEGKRGYARAVVEFVDDDDRSESVPIGRLRVRWAEVASFDERMANIDRLNSEVITEVESDAVAVAIDSLVPEEIATLRWTPLRGALSIYAPERLSELMGVSMETIKSSVEWFIDDGVLALSSEGAVQVSAALCRAHPDPVLQYVLKDEEQIRVECSTGYTGRVSKGKGVYTDPDFAWEWYRKNTRPVHELLREWCGHRAVTAHERLAAAEAEAHRLDKSLGRALRELENGGLRDAAEDLRAEHIEERITPSGVRPLVERRHEPEVIYETRRHGRRWS